MKFSNIIELLEAAEKPSAKPITTSDGRPNQVLRANADGTFAFVDLPEEDEAKFKILTHSTFGSRVNFRDLARSLILDA